MTGAGPGSAVSRATRPPAAALAVPLLALSLSTVLLPADLAAQQADPSPAVAGVLSLATTAGPFAVGSLLGDEFGLGLVGASVLFGPLSGYAYGDVMNRGVKGLGFRSAVAAGGTLAIFALCQAGECNPFRDNPPSGDNFSGVTLGIVIVGGIVLVGSAAIDVLSVPDHVIRANEARAEAEGAIEANARSGVELSVYPLLLTDGAVRHVALGANLRF